MNDKMFRGYLRVAGRRRLLMTQVAHTNRRCRSEADLASHAERASASPSLPAAMAAWTKNTPSLCARRPHRGSNNQQARIGTGTLRCSARTPSGMHAHRQPAAANDVMRSVRLATEGSGISL